MEIRDESELANMLGMAFTSYANRVQNGATSPYKPFLAGENQVIVTVKLVGVGGIIVEEGPDVDGIKAENRYLQKKVAEKDKEIQSLNLLLEEQKEPEPIVLDKEMSAEDVERLKETFSNMTPEDYEIEPMEPLKKKEAKKKRSRKRQ